MKNPYSRPLVGVVLGALLSLLSAVEYGRADEKTLYSFCSQTGCPDGANPYAGLVEVNGTLYGTASTGGSNGMGTVFSVDPNTGAGTVVHSFCSQTGCPDGAIPYAGLFNVNGTLYGTTYVGGINGDGTVFSVDPNTGMETVVYSFCTQQYCTDGKWPSASLIEVNGVLYGTTLGGGAHNKGTAFALDPTSRAETVLYSFCRKRSCMDGTTPQANLVEANGTLYGTTSAGGISNDGVTFAINLRTGREHLLSALYYVGAHPKAGLIDVDGTLYGTTSSGGDYGDGALFSVDPNTGTENVVHSFCCADGANPSGTLIEANGVLYGTTEYGGTSGGGTVFSLNPATGVETVLYSLCSRAHCRDGQSPAAGLLKLRDKLYGTTEYGGDGADHGGDGTIFWVKTP